MLHGLSTSKSTSKYILFLDNDIALYEKSISKMVTVLEENNHIFAVTGTGLLEISDVGFISDRTAGVRYYKIIHVA